jgi:hypothetical protein
VLWVVLPPSAVLVTAASHHRFSPTHSFFSGPLAKFPCQALTLHVLCFTHCQFCASPTVHHHPANNTFFSVGYQRPKKRENLQKKKINFVIRAASVCPKAPPSVRDTSFLAEL